MLESSPDRRLPRGWRPAAPFPLTVRYWEQGRGPDVLWVMPFFVDASGRVVHYMAVGPAGKPAASHLVKTIDLRRMPANAKVQVVTEQDPLGRTVFGRLNHTMN